MKRLEPGSIPPDHPTKYPTGEKGDKKLREKFEMAMQRLLCEQQRVLCTLTGKPDVSSLVRRCVSMFRDLQSKRYDDGMAMKLTLEYILAYTGIDCKKTRGILTDMLLR